MLEKIKIILSNNYVRWSAVILLFVSIGFVLNLFSYREGIDFGDGSTFYSFARNIYNGEDIYQDFIHFRTPGSYYLQAIMIAIMGDQVTSVKFALGFESQVLYILIFLIATALFFRFKRPLVGLLTGSLIIFLPAFAQLRTALAFLTVVLYIQVLRSKNKVPWLVLTGLSLGVTFMFGQEMAVAAIITIGLSEIISLTSIRKDSLIDHLRRWIIIAISTVGALLPYLIYLLVKSDVGNFLYYTIYYGFILQPAGMDVDFPDFSYDNLFFFIPFVAYSIAFFFIFMLRKKNWPLAILLSFTIARAITLVGRTDYGHLVFVLPELFLMLVICVFRLKDLVISKRNIIVFAPYATLFVAGLVAMTISSSLFVVIPIIAVLLAVRMRPSIYPKVSTKTLQNNFLPAMLLGAILVLFIYNLYPGYKSTIKAMSRHPNTSTQIQGANVDIDTQRQYGEIKSAVDVFKPQVIFSFPIQAFYYSLAPEHGARFMTFEPQTTEEEEQQTIEDLEKSRPGVIIFDPQQAKDLDKSVGRISTYIRNNYQIYKIVNVTRELWVMIPKQ